MTVDADTQPFRMADRGAPAPAMMLQRCAACMHRWYFARRFCPRCGSTDIAAFPAAGGGTVYSATVVARAPDETFRALAPYTLALVDLDEGVRVMAHATPPIKIGERVQLEFFNHGERQLPRFRAAHA